MYCMYVKSHNKAWRVHWLDNQVLTKSFNFTYVHGQSSQHIILYILCCWSLNKSIPLVYYIFYQIKTVLWISNVIYRMEKPFYLSLKSVSTFVRCLFECSTASKRLPRQFHHDEQVFESYGPYGRMEQSIGTITSLLQIDNWFMTT